ncbi:ABC transporter permease [Candidatus Woesearchaeota archaeon]|jgi:putative ABC transport system permease protein|nr:ABC transporter permease [Candidatus Woesearchaeota archaeon]MBT7063021.1 ABC transporter permease [Candidatus Woesearchaeota archaeon]MBT7402504.1 ABC transporter permease [Candidatus Woesearchaeota archaeon]
MIQDYLRIALRNITHRKLRSWLTAIGIIIGVASVVALISVSQGMQGAIEEQFEQMGTDTITITPTSFTGPGSTAEAPFDDGDVRVIERIPEIDTVLPMMYGTAKFTFHNQDSYSYLMGIPLDKESNKVWDDIGWDILEGRFPEAGKKEVGIGYLAAKEMFDDELRVKNTIMVNDEKFKIVGIAKEVGNSQDDTAIYMDVDVAKDILDQEDYNMIMAKVKPGNDAELVADKVQRKLEKYRDAEDFNALTPSEILEQINDILGIIQLVLVGIAAISLLVGAIGIMNTMYTSVLERTKEIGIMKAIGASNNAIMMIFLAEAGILGIVGGIVGTILGMIMGKGVEIAAGSSGFIPLRVEISWPLILGAISFAFLIGALSGTLPALGAAKLKPVDALRHE